MRASAGPVKGVRECWEGRCRSVELENVPSFVDRLDATIEMVGMGTVHIDLAHGRRFYAIVDVTEVGFRLGCRRS
jgi:proline racemase